MEVKEIKLKQEDGSFVEAEVEFKDGVLFVSQKFEEFEPKDGDVVCRGCNLISIYKERRRQWMYSYVSLYRDELIFDDKDWTLINLRPATEEKKQKLFDKLAEEGLEWDANARKIVELKWKPNIASYYYSPRLEFMKAVVVRYEWTDSEICNERYRRGWVFKTEEECQAFVNKLNQAIEGVKP